MNKGGEFMEMVGIAGVGVDKPKTQSKIVEAMKGKCFPVYYHR